MPKREFPVDITPWRWTLFRYSPTAFFCLTKRFSCYLCPDQHHIYHHLYRFNADVQKTGETQCGYEKSDRWEKHDVPRLIGKAVDVVLAQPKAPHNPSLKVGSRVC